VDRFLEHERVLVFGAGERERMFLSSADWMPRNFLRRVEVTWPVKNPAIRKRIFEEILQASFQDDRKAWSLGPDGTYTPVRAAEGRTPLRSQAWLLDMERQAGVSPKSSQRRKRPLLRGAVLLAPERETTGRAKWKPSAATAKKKSVKKG
jgi:polyphosphate kinase